MGSAMRINRKCFFRLVMYEFSLMLHHQVSFPVADIETHDGCQHCVKERLQGSITIHPYLKVKKSRFR